MPLSFQSRRVLLLNRLVRKRALRQSQEMLSQSLSAIEKLRTDVSCSLSAIIEATNKAIETVAEQANETEAVVYEIAGRLDASPAMHTSDLVGRSRIGTDG